MFKEKLEELMNAVYKGSDEPKDYVEFVGTRILRMTNYVQKVVNMEVLMPVYRFTKEGEEYRDAVMKLDKDRRDAHESAIDSANQLNRLSEKYLGKPFFAESIDTNDRYQVADLCMYITVDLFYNGQGRSLEQMMDIPEKQNALKKHIREEYELDR